MKILVIYFSQTGNTRQIAEAIQQELAQSNETDLITVDKTDAESLNAYDLLFLGTPIHAGGIAVLVKDLLEAQTITPILISFLKCMLMEPTPVFLDLSQKSAIFMLFFNKVPSPVWSRMTPKRSPFTPLRPNSKFFQLLPVFPLSGCIH